MSRKNQIAWGIKIGDLLLPFSIRSTRKQAIGDYCKRLEIPWRALKRMGYSFSKVSIQEVN